ncbi:MAG: hypothetical protein JSU66_15480 [Deltaproteobacteria bacterium]|nr:MAG: hypothetical protein JSU66_15480 [Deltaproteobacteria bacterium]
MSSFGKYLLENGVVSRSELDAATQSLVIYGGRLGTNLVEAGYLRLDELEQHLSRHLGVATPPAEWLENPDREALQSVPASLVERHRILPLKLEKWNLHVAMADPRDPHRVDEIAFATGLRIEPYVLSEVHLLFLVERHYGIPRPTRFAVVASGPGMPSVEAYGGAGRDAVSMDPTPADEEAARQRAVLGIHPLDANEELIDDQTFSSLHQRWQLDAGPEGAPGAGTDRGADPTEGRRTGFDAASDAEPPRAQQPPRTPTEIVALETDLTTAANREEVAAIALRLARAYASVAALFVVRDGTIHGSRSVGDAFDQRVRGILLPCSAESILAEPAESGEIHRGAPPRSGIDERLFRALGRSEARDVAVFPIKIGERVVNLLYVDNGSAPLGETCFAALEVLCDRITAAYERLIVARKRRHC